MNVGGSVNLFELASSFDVRRIVYGSSITVYGSVSEAGSRGVSEEYPAAPEDVYGGSKRYVEILGAAYKPNVDDVRESPALDVIGLLRQKGSLVSYHDPYIPEIQHDGWEMGSVPDLLPAVQAADCVVIVTNHSDYDYPTLMESAALVFDTRNALGVAGRNHPKVIRL